MALQRRSLLAAALPLPWFSGCATTPGTPATQALWPRATLHPALHLVGDSTMADKPLAPPNPERGWGQALRGRLHEPARLLNHAANGRSTRRFDNEGRWRHLLGELAAGDGVLIQFGHNDAKADDPERYAAADTDYRRYLLRFVYEVRERGASPWLATPLARRQFDADGRLQDTHGDYPRVMREVAAATATPLLEMNGASRALLQRLGPEASKALFLWLAPGQWARYPQGKTDNTHFTLAGAEAMAGLAVEEMRRLGLAGLDPGLGLGGKAEPRPPAALR